MWSTVGGLCSSTRSIREPPLYHRGGWERNATVVGGALPQTGVGGLSPANPRRLGGSPSGPPFLIGLARVLRELGPCLPPHRGQPPLGEEPVASATVRCFRRAADAMIATSDSAVGTDPVVGLSAAGSNSQSVDLTAPSTSGNVLLRGVRGRRQHVKRIEGPSRPRQNSQLTDGPRGGSLEFRPGTLRDANRGRRVAGGAILARAVALASPSRRLSPPFPHACPVNGATRWGERPGELGPTPGRSCRSSSPGASLLAVAEPPSVAGDAASLPGEVAHWAGDGPR